MARAHLLLAVTLLAGCGDSNGVTPSDAPGPDAIVIADPEPPLAPVLVPCPAGWREVGGETGVATCDPWPAGGPATCADDEAHFPGEPGCTRIGTACPAGDWPDGLPAGIPVLHVKAGATGGDGSHVAPFGTIVAAIDAASSGTIIAIAAGTYDEELQVPSGVTLWGACVSATRLTASDPAAFAVVRPIGQDVVIRNLRLGGATSAVGLSGNHSARLEDVLIDGAACSGLLAASGGSVTGETVVVRGTVACPDGTFGHGLDVNPGSDVVLERAVITANREVGALVLGPAARLELRDAAVSGNLPRADGMFGRGVQAATDVDLVLERVVLEGNRDRAVLVDGAGTLGQLTFVVARDTLPQESNGKYGNALVAQGGATVEASRILLERNHDVAAGAVRPQSVLRLTDSVVRDTQARASDLTTGYGLQVYIEARLELERVLLERNRGVAVAVLDTATTLVARDLTVRDTLGLEFDGTLGRAVGVQNEAHAELTRVLAERNRDVALSVVHPSSELTVQDLEVRDTLVQECEATGTCRWLITAHAGAYGGHLEVTRFRLARSAQCGLQLALAGAIDLHEGHVVENPIGVNVQVPGYDTARLSDRVLYLDNDTNFDGDTLPIPEPYVPMAAQRARIDAVLVPACTPVRTTSRR